MKSINKLMSVACASALLFSCSGKKEQAATATEELPLVTIEKVTEEDVPQIVSYTATVEPFKTNNISASSANRIKSILVDVGSTVAAGQTVAVLDAVYIDQQEIRIANMKREYDRAVELLNIGGGTQQSVDQLKTEYDAAVRSLKNMKENVKLISPISGVVTARNYDPGDMTGQLPILTVEQQNPVKVMVNISEQDYTKVKKGMKVKVTLDVYGDEEFEGTVYLVHPTIDSSTRTFTVEVTLPNSSNRIRTGMFARVEFNYGSMRHVVVPDRAVVKQSGSGNKYVYVYKDGKVSYNRVELGQRLGTRYELLSGVENNSDVVITGQTRLADGARVEIMKDDATPAAATDTTATK
ncbi:MAG: efflux RND transporter periplasmic adaptor subunit [Muribaculaceae bacterium]|nr:efflux RND transporter periplasmic adaptor subunit [Muribaculaceae bacterium]